MDKKLIEAATVRFSARGGQGVLIKGQMLLTAAHVVEWSHEGLMALGNGEEFVQRVDTKSHGVLLVYPLAIEPVSDLAILGALDSQWLPEHADAFETFCCEIEGLSIVTDDFPVDTPIPAQVLAHTGEWINGIVRQMNPTAASLVLETNLTIEGGTSGSPVVTDAGRLLGIVSSFGTGQVGMIPRPHRTAPVWIAEQWRDL